MMTPRGGSRPGAGRLVTNWRNLRPGARARLTDYDGSTVTGEVVSISTSVTLRRADGALVTVTHSEPPDTRVVDYDDATFAQQIAEVGLGPLATQDNPYIK